MPIRRTKPEIKDTRSTFPKNPDPHDKTNNIFNTLNRRKSQPRLTKITHWTPFSPNYKNPSILRLPSKPPNPHPLPKTQIKISKNQNIKEKQETHIPAKPQRQSPIIPSPPSQNPAILHHHLQILTRTSTLSSKQEREERSITKNRSFSTPSPPPSPPPLSSVLL